MSTLLDTDKVHKSFPHIFVIDPVDPNIQIKAIAFPSYGCAENNTYNLLPPLKLIFLLCPSATVISASTSEKYVNETLSILLEFRIFSVQLLQSLLH